MYFKRHVSPKLFLSFEKRFGIRFTFDAKNLYDTADHLDQIIFQNYIKRQAREIHEIARYGILFSGLEWHNIKSLQSINNSCRL
jgi:hypothetical protein